MTKNGDPTYDLDYPRQGLTRREVAALLGIGVQSVGDTERRAMRKLKEAFLKDEVIMAFMDDELGLLDPTALSDVQQPAFNSDAITEAILGPDASPTRIERE